MKRVFFYPVVCLLAFFGTAPAGDFRIEEGYTSLFNGKDLTGWKYGDVPPRKKPPTEVLDGKTASSDKRFEVRDGYIIAHDHGRGPNMAIFTAKQFNKDFHLKLEFRTGTKNKRNNSGVFIRGPQLQLDAVTEGGLTRVFRKLKHFKPGDWNEIDITVRGKIAICKCNGEFVRKIRVPAAGTIGLQSEIGKFEFRRIRIRELLKVHRGIPYAKPKNQSQMLDVYAPAKGKNHPIVVWIHGGGWRAGDKKEVHHKPQAFADKGFVFVSVNYRLLPKATIKQMAEDVAKAIRWVHDHARDYGGDPNTIIVAGHSAGAQLAALVCTDDSYLKAEKLPLSTIKACVPVDGDTYDVMLQIMTVEARRAKIYRIKFGNEKMQRELSAVTHVAKGKNIPPFLILHVADHPETKMQSQRLVKVLKKAGIPARAYPAAGKNHTTLNNDLGLAGDRPTQVMFAFLKSALKK